MSFQGIFVAHQLKLSSHMQRPHLTSLADVSKGTQDEETKRHTAKGNQMTTLTYSSFKQTNG